MSRRAHPRAAVELAHNLRAEGFSYALIARAIFVRLKIQVSESSVMDWVTYGSRGAARCG